jgi:hypothetical protein
MVKERRRRSNGFMVLVARPKVTDNVGLPFEEVKSPAAGTDALLA